jgi:hypothetical protein
MPLQSAHLSSTSSSSGTNTFWDRFWQWFFLWPPVDMKKKLTNKYFFSFSLSVFLLVFVIIVSLNRSSYISYSPLEMTNIWQSPLKSDQQRSVALLIHSLNVSMTLYDWAARQTILYIYICVYVSDQIWSVVVERQGWKIDSHLKQRWLLLFSLLSCPFGVPS